MKCNACQSSSAYQCVAIRYNTSYSKEVANDEPCECSCHNVDDDEDELEDIIVYAPNRLMPSGSGYQPFVKKSAAFCVTQEQRRQELEKSATSPELAASTGKPTTT